MRKFNQMRQPRCAMLVANDLESDSRVIKTASTLERLGYSVRVFGVGPEGGTPSNETLPEGSLEVVENPAVLTSRYAEAVAAPSLLPALLMRVGRLLHGRTSPTRGVDRRADWRVNRVGEYARIQSTWLSRRQSSAQGVNEPNKEAIRSGHTAALLEKITWARLKVARALIRTGSDLQARLAGLPPVTLRDRSRRKLVAAVVGDLEVLLVPKVVDLSPDLIWVHDYHFMSTANTAAGILRQKGHSVSMVYDAHEFVPGLAREDLAYVRALARYEKRNIAGFDSVVTVSECLAKELVSRHSLASEPQVTFNCPSLHDDETPEADLRSITGLGPSERIVVYSGSVSPQRGLDEVIESLELLSGWHLVVVCPARKRVRDPLAQLAEQKAVADRLHFAPYVPQVAISGYLSTADVAVLPLKPGFASYEVALANKLFEYGHAGLPVVVSDRQCQSSFVRDHGIGLVYRSGDLAQLAASVDLAWDLSRTPDFSQRIAEFKKRFVWEENDASVLEAVAGFSHLQG